MNILSETMAEVLLFFPSHLLMGNISNQPRLTEIFTVNKECTFLTFWDVSGHHQNGQRIKMCLIWLSSIDSSYLVLGEPRKEMENMYSL
ncbi:unnamed protein product, partial [Allacma fusca]